MDKEALNPWLTIWVKPRATMRWILEKDSRRLALWLAIAGNFANQLGRATMKNLGDTHSLPMVIFLCAVAGIIGGVITLYVGGALLTWTGRWMKSQGVYAEVRAAIAWAHVPVIWGLLLWGAGLALFGRELFTQSTPRIEANPPLVVALWGFGLIEFALAIWALIIFLHCLGEAQRFSAWKALGSTMLVGAGLVGLLFALAVIAP